MQVNQMKPNDNGLAMMSQQSPDAALNTELGNQERPHINLNNIKEYNDKDHAPGKSPTPRKSERDRKNISYDKLNKGAVDSDDENN